MKTLTHGSLFSGVGGFELGAELAGIKTLWNCEIEEFQRRILKQRFKDSFQYKDVKEVVNAPKVNIISGGFPCQDISIANVSKKNITNEGKFKGIDGHRSGLWSEMWRIISDVRPEYVLIENSPMLLVRGIERVIGDLSKIGYCLEWQCLQASQFGYNHKRERFYGIAYPSEKRCKNNTAAFRELQEVLSKRPPGQNPVSAPLKRLNGSTINEFLRMDDGFSEQLDKRRIESMGNAVVPEIANYLFECIKLHHALTNNTN